jgi:hypothetical protein
MRCQDQLSPGDFIPVEMDEGLKWRKVARILVLGADPEINFHGGRISFSTRQRPFNGIMNLMGVGIAGSFHHHEVGIVILVQDCVVFPHRRRSPSGKIKPRFRIEGITIARVAVLIESSRDPAILIRSFSGETIHHNSVEIGAFLEFGRDLALVGQFIDVDVDRASYCNEAFARIIKVIPRCEIIDSPDQGGFLTGKAELPAVVGMFTSGEDSRAFFFLRSAEWSGCAGRRSRQRKARSDCPRNRIRCDFR